MVKMVEVNVGDKFHMLTVLQEVERWVYPSGETRRQFLMQCDCGSDPKKMLISNFKTGSTKSCGCYNVNRMTTHGMNETRQYQCWADMKTRCDNPANKFYDSYGGRGISYCAKWKTFEGFWEDMGGSYSDDLTLNRRDNNTGYTKENCEWDNKRWQGHCRNKKEGGLYNVIGASKSTAKGKISTSIRMEDSTRLHLGCYSTEDEAAEAYDYASSLFYGDRPNKTESTREEIVEKVDYYYHHRHEILRAKGSDFSNALLTERHVAEIWDLIQSKLFYQREIAELYGVQQSTISGISKGTAWVHVTKAPRVFRKRKGT